MAKRKVNPPQNPKPKRSKYETEKARLDRNRAYLIKKGYPEERIRSKDVKHGKEYLDGLIKDYRKERKKEAEKNRLERNKQKLIDAGYPKEKIRYKDKRLGQKKLDELIGKFKESTRPKALVAEDWLLISWCNRTGEVSSFEIAREVEGLSDDEMCSYINDMLQTPDTDVGSSGLAGHVRVDIGDFDYLRGIIRFLEKLDYETIVFSNRFTKRGLLGAKTTALIMATEDIRQYVSNQISKYAYKNFGIKI